MKDILQKALKLEPQIIADRRALHQVPELGVDLPQTSAYVKKRLDEMGVFWRECGGPIPEPIRNKYKMAGFSDMYTTTGILATIGTGSPCILLRGDMDALPIQEENDLDFCSKNGNGHMCGHDSHTAMLLGAAAILKEMEPELKGTVKLMFQPGEEIALGAKMMMDDGALDGVDAAFALHVNSQVEPGIITYCNDIASASMDTFIVKIKGRGGHSSQPQNCVDPLMIANQIYQAVNLLAGRETDPAATVTLTCGVLRAGTAVNIIPETAEISIGMRTLNREARSHMVKRIPEIIENYVKAWRGSFEMAVFSTPSVWCSPELVQTLLPYIEEIAGVDHVKKSPPLSGTEDFGYVSEQVPTMFVFMGDGSKDSAPLHNPHMMLKEKAFATGTAVYVNCAVEWLNNHSSS